MRRSARPSGGLRPGLVVARLAGHEHPSDATLVEDDARLDRLDTPAATRRERVVDRLEHGQLLKVADRREDQQQLVAAVRVERVLGAEPAGVDALLVVALRLRAVG